MLSVPYFIFPKTSYQRSSLSFNGIGKHLLVAFFQNMTHWVNKLIYFSPFFSLEACVKAIYINDEGIPKEMGGGIGSSSDDDKAWVVDNNHDHGYGWKGKILQEHTLCHSLSNQSARNTGFCSKHGHVYILSSDMLFILSFKNWFCWF